MAPPKLDTETLGLVFKGRPDILSGIQKAADSTARVTLFNHIASFVHERLSNPANEEPASKRRRVDIAPAQSNGHATASHAASSKAGALSAEDDPVLLEVKDISFVVPQRKKYDLCFTKNFLYARGSGTTEPVKGMVYPWRDIEHAFYLPVPEKSQVQHNYVLFPRSSYLPTTKQSAAAAATSSDPVPLEPLVFTVPATAPKPNTISGTSAAAAEAVSDTYSTLLHWALSTSLRAAGNHACTLVSADPKLFHSAARQAYRPTEKAVHVKAFRGSKDGYLFFLPTGILWGFKKPLIFLPLDRILAVSYTSVLQRTFNIVVEYEGVGGESKDGGGGDGGEEEGKGEEIEFAMLDQEDYGGIDQNYVRRYGLADRSMAEQRKAKRELIENAAGGKKGGAGGEDGEVDGDGVVGEGGVGGVGGEAGEKGDGLTVLERAQREAEQLLQDEEDELEEDYDPGSEGDSEGSGSEDDDGDDDDDDDEDEDEEDEDEEMGDGE